MSCAQAPRADINAGAEDVDKAVTHTAPTQMPATVIGAVAAARVMFPVRVLRTSSSARLSAGVNGGLSGMLMPRAAATFIGADSMSTDAESAIRAQFSVCDASVSRPHSESVSDSGKRSRDVDMASAGVDADAGTAGLAPRGGVITYTIGIVGPTRPFSQSNGPACLTGHVTRKYD